MAKTEGVTLSPVRRGNHWRVAMAWPNAHDQRAAKRRYFGKFNSQAEAEKWIEGHRWLNEQGQEQK
jgi:hypothetical protein